MNRKMCLTVRLSESMNQNAEGKLQVWNVTMNQWNPVCGENWQVPEQSEQVCRMLGYKHANETRIQDETNSYDMHKTIQPSSLMPLPKRVYFNKKQENEDDQCKDSATSVYIECEQFGTSHPAW